LSNNSKAYKKYFKIDEELMKKIEEDDHLFDNAYDYVD
jgi:hypothetical protein